VVLVDVEVAGDLHRHVDQRMAAELLDHVVEKADPGRHRVRPRPIEIDLDFDRCLGGISFDPAGAHGQRPIRGSGPRASVRAAAFRLDRAARPRHLCGR
jgi:glyoxylate carboligase